MMAVSLPPYQQQPLPGIGASLVSTHPAPVPACGRQSLVPAPTPDIILLDLNLPKKSGQEVLAEIKSDETLKRIPVIILSSSGAETDVIKSYDM